MKFICTRENLVYSLDIASSFASKQTNLPILQNILLRAHDSGVEVSATNLEVSVKTHLRAKIEEPGSFTVPAKTLTEYVRLLTSEQVEVSLEGTELIVRSGSAETKIKGFPAEEYPVIPSVEEAHTFSLKAEAFRSAMTKVAISFAKNEIRPELSGVFCRFRSERYNGLLMAATDSYRLSEVRVPITQGDDPDVTCIIPGRVAYEISRLIQLGRQHEGEDTIRISVSQNQIAIRYDMFEMTSRLIEGRYPDYTQIIPTNFKTTAVFPVTDMVNKIKAASLFSTAGVNAVSFDVEAEQKQVRVSSTSAQTGQHSSSVEAGVVGDNVHILLNYRYVLDGLQHIDTDEAEMSCNTTDEACLLRTKGTEEFLYIVMPIRQ